MGDQSLYHHPLKVVDYWSAWTSSGVQGFPTAATAAKGQALFDACTHHLAAAIDEFRTWPRKPRRDFHASASNE